MHVREAADPVEAATADAALCGGLTTRAGGLMRIVASAGLRPAQVALADAEAFARHPRRLAEELTDPGQ